MSEAEGEEREFPHTTLIFFLFHISLSPSPISITMSVYDIIFRVDAICKKYEKYDVEKQRDLGASSDDAFSRLYSHFESKIEVAMRKSEKASLESSRASVVAMNAKIRRSKARLLKEVSKLKKLPMKKVKGISQILQKIYHFDGIVDEPFTLQKKKIQGKV